MRNAAQSDRIIELLRVLMHAYPHQRLGQLVIAVVAEGETRDLWLVDDVDTELALESALRQSTDRRLGAGDGAPCADVVDLALERARRRREP